MYMSSGMCVKRKEAQNTYLVVPCSFSPGGRYAPLLTDDGIREWAVIDFRSSPDARPHQSNIPANVCHVLFDPSYSSANIICANSTEKIVLQP